MRLLGRGRSPHIPERSVSWKHEGRNVHGGQRHTAPCPPFLGKIISKARNMKKQKHTNQERVRGTVEGAAGREGREKPRCFPSVPVTTKPPRPASSEPRTKRANHQDFQSIQTKAASRYEERGALEQSGAGRGPGAHTPPPLRPRTPRRCRDKPLRGRTRRDSGPGV